MTEILTNQMSGYGSRDQNWPIIDQYFAFPSAVRLSGRFSQYSSYDWSSFGSRDLVKKKTKLKKFFLIFFQCLIPVSLSLPFTFAPVFHGPHYCAHFHCTYLLRCDDHQSSSVVHLSSITYLLSSWFLVHLPFVFLIPSALTVFLVSHVSNPLCLFAYY